MFLFPMKNTFLLPRPLIFYFPELFVFKSVHVHVYGSRSRRDVLSIRERRLVDDFQLRFHIHHNNRFYVYASHAGIIKM